MRQLVHFQAIVPTLVYETQESQVSDCRYLGNRHSSCGFIIITRVKLAKIEHGIMAKITYECIIRIFHVVIQYCCTFRGQMSHRSLITWWLKM